MFLVEVKWVQFVCVCTPTARSLNLVAICECEFLYTWRIVKKRRKYRWYPGKKGHFASVYYAN